jgi:hypothetical protein
MIRWRNLDVLDRCCRFLLAAASFGGGEGEFIRERLAADLLHKLSDDRYLATIREVERRLADIVGACGPPL